MPGLIGRLAKKIFETEFEFPKNGYESTDQWKIISVGDIVEYAVTATDGITYRVEEILSSANRARIQCLSPVQFEKTGKYYTVPLKMLRPIGGK